MTNFVNLKATWWACWYEGAFAPDREVCTGVSRTSVGKDSLLAPGQNEDFMRRYQLKV